MLLQETSQRRDEPARVAELEDVGQIGREEGGERLQPLQIGTPVGRQLPQDRAEFPFQAAYPRQEAGQWLGGVLELFEVSDVAVGLDGVDEPFRGLLPPAVERLLRGKAIEGVVDLDGVEFLRVVSKPTGLGQVRRVERAPPVDLKRSAARPA